MSGIVPSAPHCGSIACMEIAVSSLDELETYTNQWLAQLPKTGAVVVALSGDLGVGKTTFVQCVARALRVPDSVQSPTFVLEKIYIPTEGRFTRLVHVDAYRLEFEDDRILELANLSHEPDVLIMVEWPEYLAHPPVWTERLVFQWLGESSRRIVDSRP